MKIVNEKGKLFGLINIIDLSIIVLILLIGSVFVIKSLGTNVGPISSAEGKEVTVTYRGTVRVEDQIKALKVKDQLISVLNPAPAYITSISYNVLQVPGTNAEGKQVFSPDPLRKELIVKFKMDVTNNSGIITLGTQDVAVGKDFVLKTHTFELKGTIEAIELN